MNQPNVDAYRGLSGSKNEKTLAQIMELYQAGYVTLTTAKGLARSYAGNLAPYISWPLVCVNDLEEGEADVRS